MSTTIGFGYSTGDSNSLFENMVELARKYEYGLLDGIEFCELDTKTGLEVAKKNEGWDHLHFLQSPVDRDVALAFNIHQELTDFEVKGEYPRFFNFLKELANIRTEKCEKLGVFFSGEWFKNDRVRYSYGTVDDLITLLSMPGYWGIRYLIPETGHLQDCDEIPLIFDLQTV